MFSWIAWPAVSIAVPAACAASFTASVVAAVAAAVAAVSTSGTSADMVVVSVVPVSLTVVSVCFVQAAVIRIRIVAIVSSFFITVLREGRASKILAAALILTACSRPSVDGELARLEQLQAKLEQRGVPKETQETIAVNRDSLKAAREAKSPALRLYRLRGAYVNVETLAFLLDHQNEPFEKLWKSRNAPRAIQAAETTSLLPRALVETSSNRAEKLFDASLPYGKASSPLSGLYYLANAESNARFANFVRSLPADTPQPSPTESELRAVLSELEAETLQKFAQSPTGREAIAPSSKVKEARELIDRGSLAGATLVLLEAHRDLGHPTKPEEMKLWRGGAALAETTHPGAVKVTLLRWPYT